MDGVKEIKVIVACSEVASWARGSEAWMLGTRLREAGIPIFSGSVTHGHLDITTDTVRDEVVYLWHADKTT